MPCPAQRQVHLHRVVITDVEGLGAGRERGDKASVSGLRGLLGSPLRPHHCFTSCSVSPKLWGKSKAAAPRSRLLRCSPWSTMRS